jgi:hypothetical protein
MGLAPAACWRSSGRSRGSGTANALAITSASGRQPPSRGENDAADARVERQPRAVRGRVV